MAQWVDLELETGPVGIEYAWLQAAPADAPVMVFLHEGLGSLAMWKDYPAQLCAAAQCRGLVYSRPGYGQSQPLPQPWGTDFMHVQAYQVLPALLVALGLAAPGEAALAPAFPAATPGLGERCTSPNPASRAQRSNPFLPTHQALRDRRDAAPLAMTDIARPTPGLPLVLFGHSDGATIALLFAARYPAWTAAVVAVAPHLFVEDKTLSAIAGLQAPQVQQPLLARLARYHRDPRAVFEAWSQAWLAPAFASWSIADTIAGVCCPVLGVQGADDEYGTMHQVLALRASAGPTQVLELAQCGHSPHRDQAGALTAGVCDFLTFIRGDEV